ncbi:hypothetical protein Ndes2526B_g05818 [Nannochloris sp. 'desiccata']|nr:hypothetical protein KSW81_007637 [Chlorella desiccata (nom. nud.)]
MVSTRRTTGVLAEAPVADLQPAVSPRKARHVASRSQAAVSTAPRSEDDKIWVENYRAMIRQEREAANKNIFSRVHHKITLTWHHFRISMVPFMLDPWEQALYMLGIVVMLYGLVHAIQQSVGLIAWPSMNHSTGSASTLSG